MSLNSLLARGIEYHSEHGTIRTIGATARFSGRKTADYCARLDQIRQWDRGKEYPLRYRIQAARHGLSAHSYLWLGLENADVDQYLTSGDPIRDLNQGHIIPIHDKHTFQLLTEPYIDALPAMYGTIDQGTFAPPIVPTKGAGFGSDNGICDVLQRTGEVVLKPVRGGKGTGIYVVRKSGAGFLVNGRTLEEAEISDLVADLDEYLVTEYIHQHQYAESIFPNATNTLRIFSFIDPHSRNPRVLRAAHRFGSAESAPTDNWSRGGYCAPVDTDTGEIKRLIRLDDPPRSKLDHHPETGRRVEGVSVPYWEDVRRLIHDVANLHRQAPLVGWDVVVSEDGPVLLEGNARPGKELLQLERGIFEERNVRQLLRDDEVS